MNPIVNLIPILFPIAAGGLIPVFHFKKARQRELYVSAAAIINSLILLLILWNHPTETLTITKLSANTSIALRMDGLSMVFAGLLAALWPLATIYAFEYMEHEGGENKFFTYYTITYGIAVGVALSANLITMYLFYELLTLITLPLIMHAMDKQAVHAGRKYLIYSIAGAACAFMAVMVLLTKAGTTDFIYGGVLMGSVAAADRQWLLAAYLVAFMGFGVKAAVFPFHGWLPSAGVAPTPVTALLHAVAVVKAGVFAIIRVTFYSFGTELLAGTWVQYVVMIMAAITIVFGSTMAVREQHLKRRLAYSTVSNLSYIVFGITLMTPFGLSAGLSHMVFHGIMKICLFFCAGAIICKTGREYVNQLYGFGKKMPVTIACFTIGSLALTGVPGLCGFISKWRLAMAAAESGEYLAYVGILALMISAALTAVYLFTVVIRAYFPGSSFDYGTVQDVKDPHNYMKIPLIILCTLMLLFGLYSGPLMGFFDQVAQGLI